MSMPILPIPPDRTAKVERLLSLSHETNMTLDNAVDWDQGVDRSRWPKAPEHCWIYGTPWWDRLSESDRLALAWEENAREVSMFIQLEETLPRIFGGIIVNHGDALQPVVRDYLWMFSKEEIIHTLVFRKYAEKAGLTLFRPSEGLYELFAHKLPNMPPVVAVLFTFLVEGLGETNAMLSTQSDTVDPLTRELYRSHHQEEARHLAYGRMAVEATLQGAPEGTAARMQASVEQFMTQFVAQYTFNVEITERVDLGFTADDLDIIAEIRNSENNRALNERRLRPTLHWLRKLSLVGADFECW